MSRRSLRRAGTAVMVVGLTLACGLAVPGTSARFSAQTRNPSGSSSFSAGDWSEPEEPGGLDQIVAAAVCGAAPDAAVCAPSASEDDQLVPPWLASAQPEESQEAAPSPEPSPAESSTPRPSPSPAPSHLPAPGERCETPDCVEEAVHVVGAFADELQSLREQRPEDVPAEAVRTIAEFAQELRELPEPPEEDLPLPAETIEALEALAEAGVLDAFTPECVTDVGQLAALIAAQDAAQEAEQGGAEPSPSPTATCSASEERDPAPSEPSPEPSPSAQAEPQPGTEPEPAPTGEPGEETYQDGPGHRVRRAD